MVTYYFVTDIIWQGVPFLEYPTEWDAYKIHVGAYDNEVHTCYSFTENEELWNKLKESPKVTEITQADYVSNLQRLRPPRPDVEIVFNVAANIADKSSLESLFNSKGWTFRIRERA